MIEQYLKEVRRALLVPRSQKEEILRDLQESFDTALAGGENVQDVINRFGSPSEFADTLHAQLGIDAAHKRRVRFLLLFSLCIVIAALFLAPCLASFLHSIPHNVIGQADSMTQIVVFSAFPDSLMRIFFGITALVAAVFLAVHYFKNKSKGDTIK